MKFNISELQTEIATAEKEIISLTNENATLVASIKAINNDIELKKEVITGLEEKISLMMNIKKDEVDVGRKKYEYCQQSKNKTSSPNTLKVLNNEESDFYVDLYNNTIFK